jgi:D-alanine-D-alanine ligase
MRLAILHQAVTHRSAPDESDVLAQVEAVDAALRSLGHRTLAVGCTSNLAQIKRRLLAFKPDLAFNLVESLDGHGRLIHVVPAFLDTLGIGYSGSGADALFMTSHKVLAKQRLSAAGLPTPPYLGPYPPDATRSAGDGQNLSGGLPAEDETDRWLIKSLWEHASVGLDENENLLCSDPPAAWRCMREKALQMGGACFAERFVEGREFNLSLLAAGNNPQMLSPAEIVFEGYGADRPRIVGYRAKWDAGSYEFSHTQRRFSFPAQDEALLSKLGELAVECWHLFGIIGYARVDFRVDDQGRPWILEVNANPCLSPDAGFAAALARSGLDFAAAVERILADTLKGNVEACSASAAFTTRFCRSTRIP